MVGGGRCGTIYTIAPECVVQGSGQQAANDTTAVDIWGLGVTLYIALAGRFPFQANILPLTERCGNMAC